MERFPQSDEGVAAWREFLAPYRATPVSLIADLAEEDYRIETLPHCSGAERDQLVARKLKQQYRNTPYTGAWLQGREKSRRRDDRYLFAALTNPDLLDKWLRVVHAQELPLAGVCLLPMVSAGLLADLRVNTPNVLMASRQASGLRLTFFRKGRLRLSRLAADDPSTSTGLARVLTHEIANTRLYLHAVRTASLEERLGVLLIDPNDELEEAAAAIGDANPTFECVRVGRSQLCARLGISAGDLAADTDALHLQVLGRHPNAGSIAPVPATRGYVRHRARRSLHAACAGLATVAAIWTGVNSWIAQGARMHAEQLAGTISIQAAHLAQIARQLDAATVNGQSMKGTVEVFGALREQARTPLPMMAAISEALEASPEIVLREFGWMHSSAEIQKGRTAPEAPAAPAQAGAPPAARKQSAYVQGDIRDFHGNYRAAIASIDALAERLRRNPRVAEVRAIRMPLDVSSKATLSGSTLESGVRIANPEFELLIVYEPQA
jgi:hypothetical protein